MDTRLSNIYGAQMNIAGHLFHHPNGFWCKETRTLCSICTEMLLIQPCLVKSGMCFDTIVAKQGVDEKCLFFFKQILKFYQREFLQKADTMGISLDSMAGSKLF